MATIINNDEEFNKLIDTKDILVVCYFTATWCGPCQRIAPFVNELCEHDKIKEKMLILKVDVDDCSEISEECEVRSMPTFQFYKNKKKLDEFSGADNEKLVEYIKKFIN